MAINNNVETTRLSHDEARSQILPYGFYNADTGVAVAVVLLGKGYLQPQVVTVGNVFLGSSGSYNIFLSNLDIKLPLLNRIFIDQVVHYSDWNEVESYQEGNPKFVNERAGSHGSNADNYIEASGDDIFAFFNIKYLLPIGDGRETTPHDFMPIRGMLNAGSEGGGRGWNPFESGRSIFEIRPFYRRQDFKDDNTGFGRAKETLGIKVSLKYDNTDWYNNSTKGTIQRITWAHDGGTIDGYPGWSAIQARHSQFWSLGTTKSAEQRDVDFDLWLSHSPTWDSTETIDGEDVYRRPPLFEGSTLGGVS